MVALVMVALVGDLPSLAAGATVAVLVVTVLGAATSLIFGAAVGGIAAFLLRMMTSYAALATVRATTPREALTRDRRSSIVCYLMFAVLIGAVTASSFAVLSTDALFIALTAIGGGVIGGITAAMMFFAWPPYQVRHAWLALFRLLPWRLMKFLQVARDAGVLRQSGAHYQFRHKILLDHLGSEPVRPSRSA